VLVERWVVRAHRGRATALVRRKGWFASAGEDGHVVLWTRASREPLVRLVAHAGPVVALVADPLVASLVHSIGDDRKVATWSLRDERNVSAHLLPKSSAAGFGALAFRLARVGEGFESQTITCALDGRICVWDRDVPAGPVAVVDDASAPPHLRILAAATSPSARFLATLAHDGDLRIYDLGLDPLVHDPLAAHHDPLPPVLLAQLPAHSLPPAALAWTADERQIVSVGRDACMAVFNFYLATPPE
jgi:WD40 repeat protein